MSLRHDSLNAIQVNIYKAGQLRSEQKPHPRLKQTSICQFSRHHLRAYNTP